MILHKKHIIDYTYGSLFGNGQF